MTVEREPFQRRASFARGKAQSVDKDNQKARAETQGKRFFMVEIRKLGMCRVKTVKKLER
jgi:hypothetical protein